MDTRVIQHMALLMSVNCVRKTVLDDFQAQGKLSEAELQRFMEEATDKLYTFLSYLLKESEEEKQLFLEVMNSSYPSGWKEPELAPVFQEAVALLKAARS
ncbi:hypothetical protein ACXYTJ_08760 [Gilvimarinus sp. F26214L]|uniref:hypothetical protein n=1 Tax=Gilvimarinus sp. DZF01 TaxID=3461371 RepID=UPI004046649E